MPERLSRHRLPVFLGLMLLLALASVVNLARAIGQPYGGFFVWRNVNRGTWQLEAAVPPRWPLLATGQLRYDDDLVALEGQPYDAQAAAVYAAAAARGQTTLSLTVLRDGALLEVEIPLAHFQLFQLLDIKLPDLINGFGFWLLAVTVYTAHRTRLVNQLFALVCGLLAGSLWLSIESLFPEADWLSQLLRLVWIVIAPFDGAALFHIVAVFPEPLETRVLRWVPAAYVISGMIAGMYALAELLWWWGHHAAWVLQLSSLGLRTSMGMVGAAAVFMVLRFFWLIWQRRTSRRLRSQLTLALIGLALAFPWIALNVLRTTFGGTQSYFWQGLDLRYLVLAFPLACALVILRYQTFQSAQPMLVGLLILLSSALAASVGAWLVPFLAPESSSSVGGTLFPTLFIIALTISLFWSSRQAWQGAFNRLLRWEQRSYAAVRQVGQQVVSQVDLVGLPATIARALTDKLELEGAAVWLWEEKEQAFSLMGQAGQWPLALPSRLADICCLTQPLHIESADLPPDLVPLRQTIGPGVVAPLWVSGRLIGWLGLGRRRDEEIFDERDLEIIELIGQQAALFLFAALQMEQLRQVPRLVAEAQERQQFKIAQELHDTTQQFLGRLPFDLERSREAVEANPAKARAILAQSLADVENAARTLRQIRNNLAPAQLEQSLEQPLLALAEQARQRHGLEIHMTIAPEVDGHLAGQPAARHALYRLVQQALDNIIVHAQARHVMLLLTAAADRICFSVTDDGRGSSEAERAEAADRGSFGVKSMATRITSLGGEFVFQSAPGQGTRLSGWLPVNTPED